MNPNLNLNLNLSPRLQQILRWFGYSAFYCLCLLVFAYLTFPYERLRDRIVAEFNAHQTGPKPLRLKLGDLSSYWLSGIEAEQIELISPAEPATSDASGNGEAAKPAKPKETSSIWVSGMAPRTRERVGRQNAAFT